MLTHFLALMIVVLIVGALIDFAANLFVQIRVRVVVDLLVALALGAFLGYRLSDVGTIYGLIGGALVFMWILTLISAPMWKAVLAPATKPTLRERQLACPYR